jgi:hypothetical protein
MLMMIRSRNLARLAGGEPSSPLAERVGERGIVVRKIVLPWLFVPGARRI